MMQKRCIALSRPWRVSHPLLCAPLPLPTERPTMYAPGTDIKFVRELPAGYAEVLVLVAAPMPSAGELLQQTGVLYLPVLPASAIASPCAPAPAMHVSISGRYSHENALHSRAGHVCRLRTRRCRGSGPASSGQAAR